MSKEVQGIQSTLESADNLFKAGKFTEAGKVYSKVLNRDPKDHHAVARLGYIALLGNRLEEAEKGLTKAIKLKPEDKALKSQLAWVYYRRDDFQRAAPLFRAVGREVMVEKLESFKDVTPYKIEGDVEVTNMEFVMTDPLPVVQLRVNNGEFVNFLIDTGGA